MTAILSCFLLMVIVNLRNHNVVPPAGDKNLISLNLYNAREAL